MQPKSGLRRLVEHFGNQGMACKRLLRLVIAACTRGADVFAEKHFPTTKVVGESEGMDNNVSSVSWF